MRVKIQFVSDKEHLSLAKVTEIIEHLADTNTRVYNQFRDFFVKDDSVYVFIGADIATVRGRDILSVQFSND